MARLTTATRKALPASVYGVPSKVPGPGSYPMPDRKHAAVAKAYAKRFAPPAERQKIDAKANRVLGQHPHKNLGAYLHPKNGGSVATNLRSRYR